MKISIVGAHGVGKTTLAKELVNYLKYSLIPDTAALAFQKGFVVNENTPPENQFWILTKQIEYEREYKDNFVADKSLFDNIIYSQTIFKDGRILSLIEEIVFKNAKYDFFFYIPIEINLVDDGRSMDKNFQKKIDKLYVEFMKKNNINYHTITGSVENRLNQCIKILN